jgi:hypothetical protein
LFIITWLWGLVSLFAIGSVLYHLLRDRNPFRPDARGLPEEVPEEFPEELPEER